MRALRRHIHRCHALAVALIVAALFIKMLVPIGYMPSVSDGAFAIRPCDGQSAENTLMHATMADGDHAHISHGDKRDHDGKPGPFDKPCAFSGLATPALAGADPILLASAISFIIATICRVVSISIGQGSTWLRPPQQAPPLHV